MEAAAAITCYETEPWEEAYLRERLAGLDVRATAAPLSAATLDLARDASVLSVFIHSRVSADRIAELPHLRFVATRSTGYDHVDLEACRARGIVVSNVPTYEVLGFRYVTLDDLLAQADIVSLHVPYFPATHHLVNRERLARMQRGSLLVNTARGGLVDTEALLWALDEGILAGAGLDVLEGEELIGEERQLLQRGAAPEQLQAALRSHLLLQRDNVIFTPHIAFNSEEALQRILDTTAQNVRAFLADQPTNVVS